MSEAIGRTILTVVIVAGVATTGASAMAAETIPISREDIVTQADTDIAFELSGALKAQLGAGLIYIDWRVSGISVNDQVSDTTEFCHSAKALGQSPNEIGFSFYPYGDTHAQILVDSGHPSRFPINIVECLPEADGFNYAVRVRGLYFALATQSPTTASVYDLRPVEPSIEVIQQLQAAGAFDQ